MIKKICLIAVFLLIVVGVAGITKQFVFKQQMVKPVDGPSLLVSLGTTLEKEHLLPAGPLILKGDTIEATISGVRVLMSKDKDFFSQARALQLALSQLTMNTNPTQNIKEIDLRYNKVVIR